MSPFLKGKRYVTTLVEFPPVAPKEFKAKPFFFRTTILDSCYRKTIYAIKGTGSYGYLEYIRKRIYLFKTDNYYLALSKNQSILDFHPPTKSYGGMDVYHYTIWKLLRSLEDFVHFVCRFLARKPKYIFRLSLKVRRLAKNLKFSTIARVLKALDLKGKKQTKLAEPTYPFPTISGLSGLLKAKQFGVTLSDELSSDSDSSVNAVDDYDSLSES